MINLIHRYLFLNNDISAQKAKSKIFQVSVGGHQGAFLKHKRGWRLVRHEHELKKLEAVSKGLDKAS